MQTRLSQAEKDKLKEAAISTRTPKTQTDGSLLFLLISRDSGMSPMRLAESPGLSGTSLSDFFAMSQIIDGKSIGEDGLFVKYMKEIISYKIDKGEIKNPEQAEVEINKLYSTFSLSMIEGIKEKSADTLITEKQTWLNKEIAKIQEQRKADVVVIKQLMN